MTIAYCVKETICGFCVATCLPRDDIVNCCWVLMFSKVGQILFIYSINAVDIALHRQKSITLSIHNLCSVSLRLSISKGADHPMRRANTDLCALVTWVV